MVYQQILTTSETPSEGIALRRMLLTRKTQVLHKGILLPDAFIAAVEQFAERNIIQNKEVCQQCLKAYMLEAAREHELSNSAIDIIQKLLPNQVGHIGYYLDEKEVKPVQANTLILKRL